MSIAVTTDDRNVHFDDLITLAETIRNDVNRGEIYAILNFYDLEAQIAFFFGQFCRVISVGFQHDCFLSHTSSLNPSKTRPKCFFSTCRASN